ncbi:hypothetical protein EG68_07953 [Paragonimus skrjabini miyazakii]|uniref:Uncharacterized protein n=1 Tax=Paragonimus skrjabini miyazakii TaxID=59628 RepID=A0A8S9YNS0_9TREM|nr:hypothetical protein EG68_07953 [Paragonimus skrjabini miyazakii]
MERRRHSVDNYILSFLHPSFNCCAMVGCVGFRSGSLGIGNLRPLSLSRCGIARCVPYSREGLSYGTPTWLSGSGL